MPGWIILFFFFFAKALPVLNLNSKHWTTLRSVCLCVIWHQWRGPCLSRTYGCHITLDQVMLSTGFLGYSRHPSCSSSCWEIRGVPRPYETWKHNPSALLPVGRVQNKLLKEGSLYLNPKNRSTPPPLLPTTTWRACFQCLQYHFPPLRHYCSRYFQVTCRQRDAWSAPVMAGAWQRVHNK